MDSNCIDKILYVYNYTRKPALPFTNRMLVHELQFAVIPALNFVVNAAGVWMFKCRWWGGVSCAFHMPFTYPSVSIVSETSWSLASSLVSDIAGVGVGVPSLHYCSSLQCYAGTIFTYMSSLRPAE